jgi:REP element-mobilizing transposase RayT
MSKPGHRNFGLFAHITWHTWRRERSVRRTDAETVTRGILEAAARQSVHVLAQAVLADHVHVLISFRPDRPLMPFIRDAKTQSAREVNEAGGGLKWARGYYAGSVSHGHIPAARAYIARQHSRHPDLIPFG